GIDGTDDQPLAAGFEDQLGEADHRAAAEHGGGEDKRAAPPAGQGEEGEGRGGKREGDGTVAEIGGGGPHAPDGLHGAAPWAPVRALYSHAEERRQAKIVATPPDRRGSAFTAPA